MGKDLEARKTQLKEVKEFHRNEEARLTKVHMEQLEEMWRRQEMELVEVEEEAEDRAEHLRKEIELLENEMSQLPAELVSALEEQARLEGGAEEGRAPPTAGAVGVGRGGLAATAGLGGRGPMGRSGRAGFG